ncbi:MAG: hypothetical protein CMJ34_10170 [Phycisphaerae bacterium]|nr:hypothetical protein [Phycisphaerae bacterium]
MTPRRILGIIALIVAVPLGLAFSWIGLLHFRNPEPFEAIVPAYLGWPRFWNYASGGLEILLGLGLIVPLTRRWSARLLVVLVLAMSLANLNMWVNDLPFNGTRLSTTGHIVRWLIQIVLLVVLMLLGAPWPRRPKSAAPPPDRG